MAGFWEFWDLFGGLRVSAGAGVGEVGLIQIEQFRFDSGSASKTDSGLAGRVIPDLVKLYCI